MYQEELLEHFKYPQNRKKLAHPDFSSGDYNPSCGDRMSIQGTIKDDILTDLGFDGSGCVISQATASMLTELCLGKTIQHALQLTSDDIIKLVKIPLGPTRLKCALLSLQVLQQGISDYKKNKERSL